MTEREFWMMLESINYKFNDGSVFVEIVTDMINKLDATDADDYFGTEGWRRDFGWEH